MNKQVLISRLAFFGALFALCVIGLGAFTRLVDAGLGCPDWPGCYGHWIVPTDSHTIFDVYKAMAEMIHRYFAGTLGFIILCLSIIVFSNRQMLTRGNFIFIGCLLLLLVYQILLGMWTVTLKLLPIIVTLHLLGGFLILTFLWLLYLNNRNIKYPKLPMSVMPLIFAWVGVILLFLQIFLGAWTSTNYASLSCNDFPFCTNDQPFAPLYFKEAFTLISPLGINYEGGVLSDVVRQTIQISHRLGALILVFYMLFLTFYVAKYFKKSNELLQSIHLIWMLLIIQVGLGITNIFFKLPLVTAIAHNLIAALLLITLLTLVFKLVQIRKGK